MKYYTKSGGVYEVDGNRVRRVAGGGHYTGRLSDGEWHVVDSVKPTQYGTLLIDHGQGPGQYTETSRIVKTE